MRIKGKVKLKWEKEDVDGYFVYRLTDDGWKEIVRIENTDITTVTVPEIYNGAEIVYKILYFLYDELGQIHCVKSKKIYGKLTANGKVLIYDIATPQLESVKKVNNGICVKWIAPVGASKVTRYRVFRKQKGQKWQPIVCVTGTEFVDDTVFLGQTYIYTVRCISYDEKSYLSYFDIKGKEILYI